MQFSENKSFITFYVEKKEYAIELINIQEILEYQNSVINPVHAPNFIVGVIYLHKIIVPIVDLNIFLKHEKPTNEKNNVILIVKLVSSVFGLIISGIPDIIEVPAKNIVYPESDPQSIQEYFEGVFTVSARKFFILSVKNILNFEYFNNDK